MISCFALAISHRISLIISSLKLSSSIELGREKLSPLICLSIVSSLALPNRFRDGFGDSEPLRLVLLLLALFWLLLLSLCGSVLDFSHARWRVVDWDCVSSLESGSFFSACARLRANVFAISSIIEAIPEDDRPPLEVLLPLFSVTVETGAAGAVFGGVLRFNLAVASCSARELIPLSDPFDSIPAPGGGGGGGGAPELAGGKGGAGGCGILDTAASGKAGGIGGACGGVLTCCI